MELDPVFESISKKSYESIPVNQEDYIGEDGFLYCGKCHTPKERVDILLGREYRHMVLCECEAAKQKEIEEREKHQKYQDDLRERCFRYPEMYNWTFANDNGNNPKLTEVCKNFVDHFDEFAEAGRGLLLYGSQGLGKSWFAASIANALIDKEIGCKFVDFTQIANILSDMREGRNDYISLLATYPLLILDDLDAERDTSYMDELVFSAIDARSKQNKPLLVTTNLTREKLRTPKSTSKARIISRLYQLCVPFEVVGNDQRYAELASDFGHFKQVLGI